MSVAKSQIKLGQVALFKSGGKILVSFIKALVETEDGFSIRVSIETPGSRYGCEVPLDDIVEVFNPTNKNKNV